MPFDGIVTKSIANELSELLIGSRIEKIFQPEVDEIILNIRAKGQNLRLLLSASANYPRIHITGVQKENPAIAPAFCMLLRKHLSGGRVVNVGFHDYERIVTVEVESVNDLGDLTVKRLIIEIMGRHSNIILVSDANRIMDSIKHIDFEVSSVREVMPGKPYVMPPAQNKTSPDLLNTHQFMEKLVSFKSESQDIEAAESKNTGMESYLLNNIKGFSPLLCREICHRSDVDGKMPVSRIPVDKLEKINKAIGDMLADIRGNNFSPCIVYDGKNTGKPIEFHCLQIHQYENVRYLNSINEVVDTFYTEKDRAERLKQKKSDLLRVLGNSIDRCRKKLSLQQESLREAADREKLKLYGELITANIYCIDKNIDKVSLLNYYSENEEYIEIPLDSGLTPQENAQRYFRQYTKAKSTYLYANKQLEENLKELEYLESVLHLLENCTTLQEIDEVRQELIDQGYLSLRKRGSPKKQGKGSAPLHFKSSDGFDIYVGKNNKQNDYLTLKQASSNDMWLHTRNIPGSHVIIKKQQGDIPDSTLLEAAVLSAYHSKAKLSSNVPVDYTAVKNVKKPGGAKPGMVIYENFKTLVVTPDESLVKSLKAY